MFRDDVFNEDVSLCGGGHHHKSTGLDLIGNDRILGAVEVFDAPDLDDVGTGPHNVGSHRV